MISGSVAAISQSLQLRPASIFGFVVSTLWIATISGSGDGRAGSPVVELGRWWTFLTDEPAAWAATAHGWLTQREEFFSAVSWLVLIVAAVVLAKDGFKSVKTLAGPTLVLAIALGSSLGISWAWQLSAAGALFVATFLAMRFFNAGYEFSMDDVGGIIIALGMAFAYAPLLILQWLTGEVGSEQDQLKRRQVEALERIARNVPDRDLATGAVNTGNVVRAL